MSGGLSAANERIALYQRAVAYLMEGADPVWESVPKDLREILSQALSDAGEVRGQRGGL